MDINKFLDNITSNDHITNNTIIGLTIVCILMYIFIFYAAEEYFPLFDKLTYESCIIPCENNSCAKFIEATKGKNYYLSKYHTDWNKTNCLITPYEISHFIFHIFIGYYTNIYYSLLLGVGFEAWEYYEYNCENYMDIVFNTLGAIFGIFIRTHFN